MSKYDDGEVPVKCSGCKKIVLPGQGIQVQDGVRVLRFCVKCYERICEKA